MEGAERACWCDALGAGAAVQGRVPEPAVSCPAGWEQRATDTCCWHGARILYGLPALSADKVLHNFIHRRKSR